MKAKCACKSEPKYNLFKWGVKEVLKYSLPKWDESVVRQGEFVAGFCDECLLELLSRDEKALQAHLHQFVHEDEKADRCILQSASEELRKLIEEEATALVFPENGFIETIKRAIENELSIGSYFLMLAKSDLTIFSGTRERVFMEKAGPWGKTLLWSSLRIDLSSAFYQKYRWFGSRMSEFYTSWDDKRLKVPGKKLVLVFEEEEYESGTNTGGFMSVSREFLEVGRLEE